MSDDVRYSVIIPAYNSAATIQRAIESVLAQTIKPYEIVVVNDGSQDGTAKVVGTYHPNVQLISQKNQGVSAARNTGVANTNSKYIAFLDADDAWEPSKIAMQMEALEAVPEASFCYTALSEHYPDGTFHAVSFIDPKELPKLLRIRNPGISPSCTLIRRSSYEAVQGFNPTLRGCEDWDLWIRLIRYGPCLAINEPLTLYQLSPNGLSSNSGLMFESFIALSKGTLLDDLSGGRRFLWRQRALSYQFYAAALTSRAANQTSSEFRYFLRSFLAWPSPLWHPRRYKAFLVSCLRWSTRRLR